MIHPKAIIATKSTGFVGCVQNIIVQNIEVSASLDGITGKNVQACSADDLVSS